VATSNGFWAFEMERRGASEVLGVELPALSEADWPAFDPMAEVDYPSGKAAFDLAHRSLRSNVEHRHISVYDLDRGELGGFDVVFVGTLLLHLRDPVRALTAIRGVTDGELVLNESISVPLTVLHPRSPAARLIATGGTNWWVPNAAGLRRMVEAAGFEVVEASRPYALRWGAGRPAWGRAATGARVKGLIRNLGRAVLGIPHAGIRARPRSG
jgi:tRNA (mo5U34)-methyltransferase